MYVSVFEWFTNNMHNLMVHILYDYDVSCVGFHNL